MQINLTGFLNGKGARIFMGELWAMLDSAQKSENGIPEELLTAKMEELKDKKSEEVKLKVKMMMIICFVSLVLRKHFLAKKTLLVLHSIPTISRLDFLFDYETQSNLTVAFPLR